jgi:SdpC family antimicrobial peptide
MITQIRKSVYSKFFSCFLIVAMMCYTNQDLFAKNSTVVVKTDGKEFFRALFFLDSSLLDRMPNLESFRIDNILDKPEDIANYRTHVNTIISKIERNNPTFFSTFAKEVSSGNQLRIKSAMDLGKVEVERAYKVSFANELKSDNYKKEATNFANYLKANNVTIETYSQKASAVKNYLNQNETNSNAQLASVTIVLAAAVVALLVVVVTVAIAVDGLFWGGTPAYRIANGDALVNDEMINEIAVNFNGL